MEALILLILLVMFGPPVLFLIVGLVKRSRNQDSAKVFFILGAVWLLVGGGICASLLMQ
jgi:quinol-cytochrome oxidoreductase complex cytochrome b subunit